MIVRYSWWNRRGGKSLLLLVKTLPLAKRCIFIMANIDLCTLVIAIVVKVITQETWVERIISKGRAKCEKLREKGHANKNDYSKVTRG